ncbi:lipopolysaccharide biosynthesis protein [Prevotella sp. E9-3]|uniref:lipopolysaccharide biosynthesis protein n=1 Tax=Prevotella sp. E9-3 TaxID=2913621 RepID=UPI001EDBCA45|nr:lipopolysaccharide biosynthesis protein [Prevotella sp. E9-3]UKK47607.1 lipopolysaccharide biosynthesis protein [Prevotella sp. E9-3]
MDNLKYKTKIGMYWTFLNQAAVHIMNFAVGVVMARLLSPTDYGITALPAVFMSIAGVFIDSGFAQALVRKQEVTEKDLSTSFYYSLGVGAVMYLIMFLAAPWIAVFYDTPVLTSLIRITALAFLWGPLRTPQVIILQRKLDFKTPARIAIVNHIFGAIVGISSAYSGLGLWSLIIANLTSSLMGLVQTWFAVKWIPREKFCKNSFSYLWNYGNKLMGANVLEILYINVAPIFIGKFYTPETLGVFNRAEGYAKLPSAQITGIIQGVTFPVLSRLQSDPQHLAQTYRRMMKMTCFISFPVFFLLCALARPLIISLITEKWEACIYLLQIICFAIMWWPLQSLNRSALQVQGRTDLYLKMEVAKRTTNFMLMCFALNFGIVAFCYYQILGTFVGMLFNTYYTNKLLGVGFWRQTKDVAASYILSAVMFFVVLALIRMIDNMILQLVIGGIVGFSFYIIVAYILKFKEIEDVKYMLSRKK